MVLLGGTNFNSQFIFLCVFYTILGKPICYDFFRFHALGGMERFFIREGKAFKDALDGSAWEIHKNITFWHVFIVLLMDYDILSMGNYHGQMLTVDEAFTITIRLDIEGV